MGDPALKVFSSIIPILAENMLFSSQASQEIAEFVDFVEDQEVLRQQVVASGIYTLSMPLMALMCFPQVW